MERSQVEEIFVSILSKLTSKTKEELLANTELTFSEDYKLTSLEYFPLIGELEDQLDLEIDYSEFLTKALSIKSGVDYICDTMSK